MTHWAITRKGTDPASYWYGPDGDWGTDPAQAYWEPTRKTVEDYYRQNGPGTLRGVEAVRVPVATVTDLLGGVRDLGGIPLSVAPIGEVADDDDDDDGPSPLVGPWPTVEEPVEEPTTVVATLDAEVVVADLAEAQALDAEVRKQAHHIAAEMERFGVLIEQAKAKGVHVTLGFASWVDYIADVISAAMPARLAVDERRRMVELLTSEGMSGAAQADALGVDKSTVSRDIAHNQVLHDATPDAAPMPETVTDRRGRTQRKASAAKSKAAKARKRVADPKPKPKPATPTGEDRRAYLLEELRALREFLSAVAVSGPSTRAIVAQYSAVLTEVAEIVAASDPTR